MKLTYMVIAPGVIAAGLIAGLLYFNIASAKAVVTILSGVVVPFAQLNIFSADAELNVFPLLLISLGFVCFMTLRGKYNA